MKTSNDDEAIVSMSHKDDDHYIVYNSDCSDSEEMEEKKDIYVTDTIGIGRHHGDRD